MRKPYRLDCFLHYNGGADPRPSPLDGRRYNTVAGALRALAWYYPGKLYGRPDNLNDDPSGRYEFAMSHRTDDIHPAGAIYLD